jgi:hypothetical protein
MIPVSLTLLSILCFGFLLGMRHAFDADHVVAVSTIVSRKRSIGAAALTAIVGAQVTDSPCLESVGRSSCQVSSSHSALD